MVLWPLLDLETGLAAVDQGAGSGDRAEGENSLEGSHGRTAAAVVGDVQNVIDDQRHIRRLPVHYLLQLDGNLVLRTARGFPAVNECLPGGEGRKSLRQRKHLEDRGLRNI